MLFMQRYSQGLLTFITLSQAYSSVSLEMHHPNQHKAKHIYVYVCTQTYTYVHTYICVYAYMRVCEKSFISLSCAWIDKPLNQLKR